jgi:hypothetical protein
MKLFEMQVFFFKEARVGAVKLEGGLPKLLAALKK